MNKITEQAKDQVKSYYKDFIDKCVEVHGIDMHTIIDDCVTAGFNHAKRLFSSENEQVKRLYRCPLCHSTDVKMKGWDNPNTSVKLFEPSVDEDDMANCFCNRCETHTFLEPIPENEK